MIELNRNTLTQLKHGEMTEQDLRHFIIENYPMGEIISTCAYLLIKYSFNTQPTKITITQDEFDSHFRIVGLKEDGTKETRGRKRRAMEVDLAQPELL